MDPVRAVFERQFADAERRRADPAWSSGFRSVGDDVLASAVFAKDRLRAAVRDAGLTGDEAAAAIEAALSDYRQLHDDEDGYGAATFHEIARDLRGLPPHTKVTAASLR